MIQLSYIFVTFAIVMQQLRDKYKSFRAWQERPYEVVKLSAEKHICATCHTEFHGNYCPRCGQKSTIGRYSFKSAFLLFLDVWGLGNRGMFRTIRDLLLRPGYMIRDYLSGMQMAYFPPFKMFFLSIALLVLVQSGLNIRMQNVINHSKEEITKNLNETSNNINKNDSIYKTSFDKTIEKNIININGKPIIIEKGDDINSIKVNGKYIGLKFVETFQKIARWIIVNQTAAQFLWLLVLSFPMYLLFRHNKKIPDIRYSESFVAMVYITNLMTIISIIGEFFYPGNTTVEIIACAASIIPLKQLYGYSYKKTLFKVALSFVILIIITVSLIFLFASLAGLYIEYIL